MTFLLRVGGLALAGVAQALSIAWPWGGRPLWWLQLLSLGLLVWLLDGLRDGGARRAGFWRGALGGWVFATVWLAATFWWLFVSMHVYGGLAAPLAALAVLALAAALGLYYAAACGSFVAFAPAGRARAAIFFIAAWTLAELLRGSLFTGFPWGAGGYAHVDGPLAAAAPWLGVYGIGALAAGIAASAALLLAPARAGGPVSRVPAAVLLVVLALAALLPAPETRSSGALSFALLQGNIPQDEKFVPGGGVATALQWYGQQLRQPPQASLVVTPETALPMLPSQLPPGYFDAVTAPYRFGDGRHAAIIGIPLGEQTAGGWAYGNGLLGLKPGQDAPYRYVKHHLVPFGEFVPAGFHWFVRMMNIPLGDFHRGPLPQPPFDWQGQRIAPDICYEDLFGEEIGASFRDPATAPTVLLNLSNIAWFGDTVAIDQHLAISRMRALEFARPMVRATNTGATAAIDYRGRVTAALPRYTRGVLLATVEGRSGLTPYARWVARFGLAPLWLAALAGVLLAGVWRRRR